MFSGDMNPDAHELMKRRSPKHYCDQGRYPQADMLLLQGIRDTVFTLNQGYDNYLCAREGGRDARLIGLRDGHVLPWPTQTFGMPFYTTQDTIVCDGHQFDTFDMIVQWYDLKLKGIPEPQPIPELCVTLSDDQGVVQNTLPDGHHALKVKQVSLSLTQTGWYEYIFRPMEWVAGLILPARMPRAAELQPVTGGRFRPLFVPLDVMTENQLLVGTPQLDLNLTTTASNKDAVVLAALGVRKAGTPLVDVLSEQYIPLKGDGQHQLSMPAVAVELERGDTLGLVLQGYAGQYFFNQRGRFSSAKVSGHIRVPYPRQDEIPVTAEQSRQPVSMPN
jgi:ABC-2 type transport system ATP-binding protein